MWNAELIEWGGAVGEVSIQTVAGGNYCIYVNGYESDTYIESDAPITVGDRCFIQFRFKIATGSGYGCYARLYIEVNNESTIYPLS